MRPRATWIVTPSTMPGPRRTITRLRSSSWLTGGPMSRSSSSRVTRMRNLTRDELESSRAHLMRENDSLRKRNAKLYDKLRLLENAVRDTIKVGERIDTDKLYQLRMRVPATPRPTTKQLRAKRHQIR